MLLRQAGEAMIIDQGREDGWPTSGKKAQYRLATLLFGNSMLDSVP